MGVPVRGHAVEELEVSSNAGRPPTHWAATFRFFLALCLVALGCALLIASFEPKPAAATWVGSR